MYNCCVVLVVDCGVKMGKYVVDDKVVLIVGGVVGIVLIVWDVVNVKCYGVVVFVLWGVFGKKQKKGLGFGLIVVIVFGVVVVVGVLYVVWQVLCVDDEFWVVDDLFVVFDV